MRALILVVLLTGCAGTQWESYEFGPGDWLAQNIPSLTDGKGLEIEGANYTHYVEPVITVHVVDDLMSVCGTHANGCAKGTAETCDIYIGERSSQNVIEHEKRHCYGWTHATSGKFKPWYPKTNLVSNQE